MAVTTYQLADTATLCMELDDLTDSIDGWVERVDDTLPPGWERSQACAKLTNAQTALRAACGFLNAGLGGLYVDSVGNSRPDDVAEYEVDDPT